MTYVPAPDRYDQIPYRRCGRSGIKLPEISLGLWQNFGSDRPLDMQRAIILRAFDLGVTHFDLANNYGGHTLNTSDDPWEDWKPGRPTARPSGTSAASCARTCGPTATS